MRLSRRKKLNRTVDSKSTASDLIINEEKKEGVGFLLSLVSSIIVGIKNPNE